MNQATARQRLDVRLAPYRGLVIDPRPHRGWIRAIREALGMSGQELAARLGVTQQSVLDIERSEQRESIKLETLRRVADALDCDVVYALVPRQPLQDAVQTQARHKAVELLGAVAHHSRLEDQSVTDDELSAQIDDLAARFVDRRGLWSGGARR